MSDVKEANANAGSAPACSDDKQDRRRFDLGRETEMVTWDEWIRRARKSAKRSLSENEHEHLRLIVTLRDGRRFRAARTECHTQTISGEEDGKPVEYTAVTGYVFLGHYEGDKDNERLVAIVVQPALIASVEWMEIPVEEERTFGFAALLERARGYEEIQDTSPAMAAGVGKRSLGGVD